MTTYGLHFPFLTVDGCFIWPFDGLRLTGMAEHFPNWGLGGLTSDFNWGAEETLLLVSLYFFGKIGGDYSPPSPPGSAFPIMSVKPSYIRSKTLGSEFAGIKKYSLNIKPFHPFNQVILETQDILLQPGVSSGPF